MKPVSTLATAFIALMLVTTACKKDSTDVNPGTDPNPVAPTFVGVRWQMANFDLDPPQDLDGDGKPDTDLLQFLRPCDRDDTVIFERNGSLSGDSGKLTCEDEPATHKPGSWTYDNATRKMKVVDGDDGTVSEWTVIEASASYLKVKTTITEDGKSLSATITWKVA